MNPELRASRNQTLTLTDQDQKNLKTRLLILTKKTSRKTIQNRTICQDLQEALPFFPHKFVDLLFLDPPYNLPKTYNNNHFKKRSGMDYVSWMQEWLQLLLPLLKPTATIYVCADWRTSALIYPILSEHFRIQNRITWEREKGRGAKRNWKNCIEDIWYCTMSNKYTFNTHAVKLKRKVIAPYKDTNGNPKDWEETESGNYRITYPSNLWTDISVPFWSMPENTDHPTQKPEKLLAKLILASTKPKDIVLDPFLGSGTTSVAAKKLGRKYVGIERDEMYCCMAEKRLELAEKNPSIQGYSDGVFWERNTHSEQRKL